MAFLKKVVGGGVGYAVAGPAGALLGVALASGDSDPGYDMSDIPVGVHVEASYEDDDAGRRWSLQFLSEVPAASFAKIHLLTDAGRKLEGSAPFVDAGGDFTLTAPIHKHRSVLYVPFGALEYTSPKYISLEVSVWSQQKGRVTPVGKGTLDADLPTPRVWRVADFLRPVVSLCARVMMAGGVQNDAQLRPMVERLAGEFDAGGPEREEDRTTMLAFAARPDGLREAATVTSFRFPGLAATSLLELLTTACFGEREAPAAETAVLDEIAVLFSSIGP